MKCPSCGGFIRFDIPSQQLKCKYCGNVYDPSEYDRDNSASSRYFDDVKYYVCKSCGAEVVSMDENSVSYCSYCGSEVILRDRMEGSNKPRYIIPFKFSKRRSMNAYQKEISKKWYVPSDFKDPSFIEKFRGIYIPYWMYDVRFRNDPIDLNATKDYTSGGYDYHEQYHLVAQIDENGMYGIPNDASRYFDDTLAGQIAPYQSKDLVDYKDGYLAGFYADAPNVDSHIYTEDVIEQATDAALDNISKRFGNVKLDAPRDPQGKAGLLGTRFQGSDTVYLPVWFLTWRKKDRVAYSVVNGQTGKLHTELPVDKTRFFLITALIAAGLFVLMSLFLTPTSRFTLWFSSFLVYLVSRSFMKELREIRNKENHVFDKGYLLTGSPDIEMPLKTAERIRRRVRNKVDASGWGKALFTILIVLIAVFGWSIVVVAFMVLYDVFMSNYMAKIATAVFSLLNIIVFFKSYTAIIYIKRKSSLLTILLSLAASLACALVAFTAPVNDIWYYSCSIFCLLSTIVISLDLIGRYNERSTRSVASFFTRTGGADNASD